MVFNRSHININSNNAWLDIIQQYSTGSTALSMSHYECHERYYRCKRELCFDTGTAVYVCGL